MIRRTKTSRRSRPKFGSLLLISAIFVTSALIRIGSDAGQVFAKGQDIEMAPESSDQNTASCEPPEDLRRLLKVFQEREERIAQQESLIRNRIQALAVSDAEISKKTAELIRVEDSLRATIALAQTAAEDDLTRLAQVYETMKPKDAAALFEEMDADFAAGFIGRMTPESAAGVMAGLTPESAYTISVILAGRNAEVPKN